MVYKIRTDQESKATTPALRSGAVRKRISSGGEGSYRRLEGGRWKPGFSQAKEINFMVKYKVLQKLRFMVLRNDGRGRANIEVSKGQVVRSGNRTRIDFDVTSKKEQEDKELAGNMAGYFKFTRRDHGTVEKKDGRNFVKSLRD